MDFTDIINNRRACHHFKPGQKIPTTIIEKIITAASLAPSGYNAQPWEFVVVDQQSIIDKIHSFAFKQKHIKDASALIFTIADTKIDRHAEQVIKDWVDYKHCPAEKAKPLHDSLTKNRSPEKNTTMALRNAMIASTFLMLAAENEGLATCPMMGISQVELRKTLNLPQDRVLALMLAVGYPAENHPPLERLPRKQINDLIHWNTF